MDALRVYTWNGAYITFEEDIKGSIETGKLADMAILDTDILTCDPADIVKTKVFMTILDGRIVFTKK
jgi:predicted amidohydrolase YtcJ